MSRDAGGYVGLYDPAAGRIEVAYWAGQPVIVHEAAHGWFNGSLLADRWANEGFASLYAGRLAALKIKAAALAVTEDAGRGVPAQQLGGRRRHRPRGGVVRVRRLVDARGRDRPAGGR